MVVKGPFFKGPSPKLETAGKTKTRGSSPNLTYLISPKFIDDRFVRQKIDILDVIPGLVLQAALVDFLLVTRFVRINAFQNTQTPKRGAFFQKKEKGKNKNLPKIFQRQL